MSPGHRVTLLTAYVVEGLTSVASTMLMVSIFFYTEHLYGWTLAQNFMLAAGQGVMYVIGALLADPFAARVGRRKAVVILSVLMAGICTVGIYSDGGVLLTIVLLAYTVVCAAIWPLLESLVSSDADAHTLSRRIGIYNLVWSGVGAVMVAVCGSIIQFAPGWFFPITVAAHAAAAVVMWPAMRQTRVEAPAQAAHFEPEPELLRARTLALWLSRLSLPATYVVIYGLMAMMPSLPIMRTLEPSAQTLLGSIWLAARWILFLMLGYSVWWHTRPRVLLVSAIVMLGGFLGVTMLESIPAMAASQVALGAALGIIYMGSLYFGMVLSEGSTEHGGYHEALIGLGSILGPGAGAAAQLISPGSVTPGIIAVGSVIALSVLATVVVDARFSRR
jgi:MFS family permease